MYFDPFDEINRMHEEMDRMFSRFFRGSERPLLESDTDKKIQKRSRSPVCHLQETENNIIAAFELPGVDKKDITVNVTDDSVEVKVESKKEKKEEKEDRKYYSVSSQSFYRQISLPKEVDSSKAKAKYENGVLRVEAPKKEDNSKRRRLDVN